MGFPTPNAQAVSSGTVRTTAIVNYFSAGGTQAPTSFPAQSGIKSTLSGALTANTLKTMLNITGSAGSMYVLGLVANDATSRALRLKVTIDGSVTPAFDANGGAATSNNGISAAVLSGNPIRWKSSCLVEISSSLTETDKLTLGYMYNLES